jgi:tetratricopeptide (TPR) repeat protein
MGRPWIHWRVGRLGLLLIICLSAVAVTAVSQPRFDHWYEKDMAALAFPIEARIAALRAQAEKYRRAGLEFSFLRSVGQIVASYPRDPRVLGSAVKLLTEYGKLSDCELAVDLTTEYLAWNSPESSVFSDRSSASSCLRDHIGAFHDLTKALEVAPDNFELMEKRLFILNSVEVTQVLDLFRIAIEDCERKISTRPVNIYRYKNLLSNAYLARSYAHRKLGDKASRLADLTRAIESWPFKTSPYYRERAVAFREEKNYNEAIADMNSYFEYLTESRRLSYGDFVYRALLFVEAGRYSEAIADYLIAAERAPQYKTTYQIQIDDLRRKLR